MKIVYFRWNQNPYRTNWIATIQQINTCEINDNTENFKETGKTKKSKLNHQHEYRIPLTNSFEILPIEECQDKQEPTDEDSSVLPSFILSCI